MIFVIANYYKELKNEGFFFWGRDYIKDIKQYLPSNIAHINTIKEGIVYFSKSELKDNPPLKIKISSVYLKDNYLKINYVLAEKLNNKSFKIRDALKLYLDKKSVLELPYCAVVDENRFFEILSTIDIHSEIYHLQLKQDWLSIYNLMKRFEPIEKSAIWNNADLLNKFSFATAKLSECTENLKKKFPDKQKRNQYISQKKQFRDLTIKLRKRCIELDPNNATYYSNLAYTYYQSVQELLVPGGRKDGDVILEVNETIKYLDKATEIDKFRLIDHYRKAILLSEVLSKYLLYKKEIEGLEDVSDLTQKQIDALNLLVRGQKGFRNVINLYENLLDTAKKGEKEDIKNRYRKYYIKSLYHYALNSVKYIKTSMGQLTLTIGHLYLVYLAEELQPFIDVLKEADDYITRCIIKDYNKDIKDKTLLELVDCNNYIVGVYKAYLKGLINTYLYSINGDKTYLQTAKKFLDKAIEIDYPGKMKNQSKIFVIEKKAVLNILESKSDAAINLLEPLYERSKTNLRFKFPEYAAYTLAIAYKYEEKYDRFNEIIERYSNSGNEILRRKFLNLNDKFFVKIKFDLNFKISE
jgi:hypothetical protein